jgi:hypothetical protein
VAHAPTGAIVYFPRENDHASKPHRDTHLALQFDSRRELLGSLIWPLIEPAGAAQPKSKAVFAKKASLGHDNLNRTFEDESWQFPRETDPLKGNVVIEGDERL